MLLQLALALLALFDVLFQLSLKLLGRRLKLQQFDLQRLILCLVVGQLFRHAAPPAARG